MTHNEQRVARLAADLGFKLLKSTLAGFMTSVTDLYCLEGLSEGHPHVHQTSLSSIAFFLIERATDGDEPFDDDIYVS